MSTDFLVIPTTQMVPVGVNGNLVPLNKKILPVLCLISTFARKTKKDILQEGCQE